MARHYEQVTFEQVALLLALSSRVEFTTPIGLISIDLEPDWFNGDVWVVRWVDGKPRRESTDMQAQVELFVLLVNAAGGAR